GADAELAAELVGPRHELTDVVVAEVGFDGLLLTLIPVARGGGERNEVAFLYRYSLAAYLRCENFFRLVDADAAGADHTGPTHAASYDGGVARLAADRGEDAFRHVHSVNVVGRGFLADQKNRALRRHFN